MVLLFTLKSARERIEAIAQPWEHGWQGIDFGLNGANLARPPCGYERGYCAGGHDGEGY